MSISDKFLRLRDTIGGTETAKPDNAATAATRPDKTANQGPTGKRPKPKHAANSR